MARVYDSVLESGDKNLKFDVKLISENPDIKNIKRQILKNRGIEDVDKYLNLGTHCLHDYNLLGKDKLENVFNLLEDAIMEDIKAFILVDTDVDGYCSAALLYRYLKDFLEIDVEYILNKNKRHGLQKEIVDYLIAEKEEQKGLLFIPDAGTNDTAYCKLLSDYYNIVVIDHHPKEENIDENIFATIINPQVCDYPNKNLCGAAVVYKVLQYLDDQYEVNRANRHIDLVGIAMVADIMDLRNLESRFLTTRGLMNIENRLIKAIIDKKKYDISNTSVPNAIDTAFYISPMINACIRTGNEEETDNLFRAFIEADNKQTFKYKPRKSKINPNPVEIDEDFYTHVVRICSNLKSTKQDKVCEKECGLAVEQVRQSKDTKLLILRRNQMDLNLIGVLANKVANTIQKPTLILRESGEDENGKIYSGSARNYKNSYVLDLKKDIANSGLVIKTAGHGNAFGVEIYEHNVPKLIDYFEEIYADTTSNKTFFVDYIFNEIPFSIVREINEMKALFSNFVDTPYLASNINISAKDIQVLASQNGNLRFVFNMDNVEYVKFKISEDDEIIKILDKANENDILNLNMVGKANVSFFGGTASPQFIIEDYEVALQ